MNDSSEEKKRWHYHNKAGDKPPKNKNGEIK
jgi:hypothetical protein